MEAAVSMPRNEVDDFLPRNSSRPSHYPTTAAAHDAIMTLGHSIPRRVCQHPFRRNDIVWVCRTCQSDETCVLCHACYSHSNHEGHDVAFYHAQAGGCCDCGDPDAWDPAGFCDRHGPNVADGIEGGGVGGAVVERVQGAVGAAMDWLVEVIHESVEGGYERANPGKGRRQGSLRRGGSLPVDAGNEGGERKQQRRRRHSVDNAAVGASGSATGRRRLDDANVSSSSSDEGVEAMTTMTTTGADDMLTEAAIAVASLSAVAADHIFDPEAASTSKSMLQHISGTDSANDAIIPGEPEEFDPEAASTSKSASPAKAPVISLSPSQLLGEVGRTQRGLYLVLHADDHVHSTIEITKALHELYTSSSSATAGTYTSHHNETVLSKVVRLLRANGDIILWGTHELLAEVGDVKAGLWRDGDAAATSLVGKTMLDKARVLTKNGLVCSIKTRQELLMEQRAASVIHWMSVLSRSCDPLCNRVSVAISGHRHLVPLLHSDLKLPRQITSAWHSLLLTLLAVPSFKADLANAYCDTYRTSFGRGTFWAI
uniref:E3 ubiquitin-protein ligase n=1 Tax=Ditylum brightwellii TaxID=49249 RepID=A0A7S4S346_9STRA